MINYSSQFSQLLHERSCLQLLFRCEEWDIYRIVHHVILYLMYGTYVWSSYQLQKYIFFTKLMRNLIFILTPLKFFGESLHYKHGLY